MVLMKLAPKSSSSGAAEFNWSEFGLTASSSTKDKMIVLAIKEIQAVGPADFNAMHVCDALGIKHPMVNHYFGNRDGLLAEATWWAYQDWSRNVRRVIRTAPANAEKRLRAFVAGEIEWAKRMGGMYLLIQYPLASRGAQAKVAEQYQADMEKIFEFHLALLAVIITDLRNGTVSPVDFDADSAPKAKLLLNPSAVITAGHIAWMTHGVASWSSGHHVSTQNFAQRGVKNLTVDIAVKKYADLIVQTAVGG